MRASALLRLHLAFDLLDKAEALLRYSDPGAGFKDLLRRSRTVRRLSQSLETLPGGLATRFRRHTQLSFDLMYDDIRAHALATRRTPRGLLIARTETAKPTPMPMDEYVAELVRAVGNSAHGLGCVVG